MASVLLGFLPPVQEDIVKLHIYESATKTGTFVEIEEVTAVGTYPDYIDSYTTTLATSVDYWFMIQWENDLGALMPESEPARGRTLLAEIVDRVLLRSPGLDENVIAQEAEAVIWSFFGTLDVNLSTVTPQQLSGITYLTLARAYMSDFITTSSSSSYVAGLISEKITDSKQIIGNIQSLIDLANIELGRNISIVMLMEDIQIGASVSTWQTDQSRLIRQVSIR